MAEKKMITTRALPSRMVEPEPVPDPDKRPFIMSHRIKLRSPDIAPGRLGKAIDRSGETKVLVTTHDTLPAKEPGEAQRLGRVVLKGTDGKKVPIEDVLQPKVKISKHGTATIEGRFLGQAKAPTKKGKVRR